MNEARATEESPLAYTRASDEDRPAIAIREFDSMRCRTPSESDGSFIAVDEIKRAVSNPLAIAIAQQPGRIEEPRMGVPSAVVVAALEAVQIDIEEPVARDDPPADEVRTLFATDDEVWYPARCSMDDPICDIHAASRPKKALIA